jgi:hypothetical protein
MTETFACGIHLVRVTTDDRVHQLWAAATLREEAVALVLNTIPEGWAAILLDTRLRPGEAAFLEMKPGEIRELKD